MNNKITQRDVIIASLLGPKELSEASLGRVYQHFMKSGEKSWAIISSDRPGKTPAQQQNARELLREFVRGLGLGFSRLKGFWTDPDTKETSYESSLFIPGITKEQALRLMTKFSQDAVLYAGPDTHGNVTLIWTTGKEEDKGKFHPGSVGLYWSEINGHEFHFESSANSHFESMMFEALRKEVNANLIAQDELLQLDIKLKSISWP
jgi:hypothetical protein